MRHEKTEENDEGDLKRGLAEEVEWVRRVKGNTGRDVKQ